MISPTATLSKPTNAAASNMISYVFVATLPQAKSSTELDFAYEKLCRALPKDAVLVHLDAVDAISLWRAAGTYIQNTEKVKSPGDRCCLLLCSRFLRLTPVDIDALEAECIARNTAVVAPSNRQTFSLPHPDYFTIRGLERYKGKLAREATFEVTADDAMSAVCAPILALSNEPEGMVMTCLPTTFTHDFGAYHAGNRADIIDLIPDNTRNVLDVGGGEGLFLRSLSLALGCQTHLCEVSPAICEVAKTQGNANYVWPGDFLEVSFDRSFDCITFLDVLEHVNAPDRYLQRAVDLLTPAGLIICSIPNVGHWSCVLDLIEGRWDYAPAGIHCATHVRFFTPHSIQSMFRDLGLEVIEWVEVKAPAPDTLDLSMLQRNFNVNQTSLDTYAIHAAVRPRK